MGRLAWVRIFVLTSMTGGAACVEPASLDGRVCPCAEGYRCCESTLRCLPMGRACPAPSPAPSPPDAAAARDAVAPLDAPAADQKAPPSADAGLIFDAAADVPPAGPWAPLPAALGLAGRSGHTAVWTGAEMIVWGGQGAGGVLGDGARFDPSTGRWSPMTMTNAPKPRRGHTAVWTGWEMLVWGGDTGDDEHVPRLDGASYDPRTDHWTAVPLDPGDVGRTLHSAVWTGDHMIVWAGKMEKVAEQWNGASYYPGSGWSQLSILNEPPSTTFGHTAVWADDKMIVWGGLRNARHLATDAGAIYDPRRGVWRLMTSTDVPAPRGYHTAVWTGAEMIVWGGVSTSLRLTTVVLNDGGRYDPKADRWTPVYTGGSGGPRAYHTGVWAENPDRPGGKLIVFGGLDQLASEAKRTLGGGALYDPTADRWNPLTTAGAPPPRAFSTAVWTGRQMILWGGMVISGMETTYLADGARYSP